MWIFVSDTWGIFWASDLGGPGSGPSLPQRWLKFELSHNFVRRYWRKTEEGNLPDPWPKRSLVDLWPYLWVPVTASARYFNMLLVLVLSGGSFQILVASDLLDVSGRHSFCYATVDILERYAIPNFISSTLRYRPATLRKDFPSHGLRKTVT